MFDDFMQNDFPEMHLNQIHQDAMLHAQNRATDQAMRAQQEAAHGMPALKPQAPSPVPSTRAEDEAMNLGLLFQTAIAWLLNPTTRKQDR